MYLYCYCLEMIYGEKIIMPYLIYVLDHDDMDTIRETMRNEHRSHLKSAGKKLLASGALLAEDGNTIIGGMSLLDTEDYEEAQRFAFDDPYQKAGIRKEVKIIKWRKRWWEGEFKE